jgi:hypothetical protein
VSMVGPLMMSHANAARPGTAERAIGNMPMARAPKASLMRPGQTGAPNAGMYPGYPQDMFIVMDELVAKPETYGLRPGWTAGTMGMMTIVRVLEPALFDKIQELKAEQAKGVAR